MRRFPQKAHTCSVPEDILEHLVPDLTLPEPSITASWDEDSRALSPSQQETAGPGCSKRHASTRHSASRRHSRSPESSRHHRKVALSSSASTRTPADTPELPPLAGRRLSSHSMRQGHSTPDKLGNWYSLSPGSHDKYSSPQYPGVEELSSSRTNTTSITPSKSPVAVVSFSSMDLPEPVHEEAARHRRKQAEYVNKYGPPRPKTHIRPVSADPASCELNAAMMMDACGVDSHVDVEVR
jgi:hypothetical protein